MKKVFLFILVLTSVSVSAQQFVFKKTMVGKPFIVKASRDSITADTLLIGTSGINDDGIQSKENYNLTQLTAIGLNNLRESFETYINQPLPTPIEQIPVPKVIDVPFYTISPVDYNLCLIITKGCTITCNNIWNGFKCKIIRAGDDVKFIGNIKSKFNYRRIQTINAVVDINQHQSIIFLSGDLKN